MSTPKLLATDWMFSPLSAHTASSRPKMAYTVYGHRAAPEGLPVTGFTGQLCESGLGGYLLGTGYRVYNPVLMRFHAPDRLSPFDRGGLNAYAYCSGNPVNNRDPSGLFMLPMIQTVFAIFAGLATFGVAVNRRAADVVKAEVARKNGQQPVNLPLRREAADILQAWGGGVGAGLQTWNITGGLSASPADAGAITKSVLGASSSLNIGLAGSILADNLRNGWVDQARKNDIPLLTVSARTVYGVSGLELLSRGVQAGIGHLANGMSALWNASGGRLVRWVRGGDTNIEMTSVQTRQGDDQV